MFVLPNLVRTPSLVMIAVAAVAGVWIAGCIGRFVSVARSDELMLCGSAAPLVVGLWTSGMRIAFIWTHRSLSNLLLPDSTPGGFLASWLLEILLLVVPGVWFLRGNYRSLEPAPTLRQHPAASRPSSRSKRT